MISSTSPSQWTCPNGHRVHASRFSCSSCGATRSGWRVWFVFDVTVDPIPGARQPSRNYVPAETEDEARDIMRRTVDPKLVGRVDTWPCVDTLFCTREHLPHGSAVLA